MKTYLLFIGLTLLLPSIQASNKSHKKPDRRHEDRRDDRHRRSREKKYDNSRDVKGFFTINPTKRSSDALSFQEGEAPTLSGSICYQKERGHYSRHRCQKIHSGLVKVRAFFPDRDHEVTQDLELNKSRREWTYSYKTPALSTSHGSAQLIIVIESKNERYIHLLEEKKKFISELYQLIEKLDHYSKNRRRYRRHIPKLELAKNILEKKISALEDRIGELTEQEEKAVFEYPLYLQGQNRDRLFYANNQNDLFFSLEVSQAPIFQKQVASLKARVKNIQFKEPRKRGETYKAELSVNGEVIKVLESSDFREEDELLIDALSQTLDIDQEHKAKLSFYKVKERLVKVKKRGWKRKRYEYIKKYKKEEIGELAFVIPVLKDQKAPVWTNISPLESFKETQNFPIISATLSDELGELDLESILVKVTDGQGSSQEFSFGNGLTVETQNAGRSAFISAELSSLFSEGQYTVSFSGKDLSGNLSELITRSFIVDQSSPIIELLVSDNTLHTSPQYTFKAKVSDQLNVISKIFLNDQLIHETQDKNIEVEVTLKAGTNKFRIEAVDSVGNIAQAKSLNSIELDAIAPVITLVTNDNQLVKTNNFNLSINISDQSQTTTKIFQNGNLVFTTEEKQILYSLSLTEGLNQFEIRSVDQANNQAISKFLNSITLDSTSPSIEIFQNGNLLTNERSFLFSGKITDSSSVTYRVLLNGIEVHTGSLSDFSHTLNLEEGENTIELIAIDSVSNQSSKKLTGITLDTIAPTLTLERPNENELMSGNGIVAKALSSEPLLSGKVNNVEGVLDSLKTRFERIFDVSVDGESTITYEATDLAGNKTTLSRNIIVDNTPPEVQILSRHGFDTTSLDYLFKLQINEIHDVSVQVFFNGVLLSEGDFKSFERALTLNEGENSFLIIAKDEVGNENRYESRKITVDSTIPTITSTTDGDILTNIPNLLLNARFSDNSRVRYEVYQNGELINTDYGETLNLQVDLKEGGNDFVIKAQDLAGNSAQDYLVSNIVLDTVKPIITNSNQSDLITNEVSYEIQGTIEDIHVGKTEILQNNVVVFETTSSSFNYSSTLSIGKNQFIIRSTDLAGNIADEVNIQNIQLNNSKPIITSTSISNKVVTDSTYSLNLKVTDDLNTTTKVFFNDELVLETSDKDISKNYTLQGGENSFRAIATDRAGNQSDVFRLENINFDNIAPIITSSEEGETITSQKMRVVDYSVDDASNVEVKFFLNDQLVATQSSKSGNVNLTLQEGNNTLTIRAIDLAGNQATPLIVHNLVLDSIKPVIVSNFEDGILTSNPNLFIGASAFDFSELNFQILLNEEEIGSETGSLIERLLTLNEGQNKIEFRATDLAGNIADPLIFSHVVLDTTPPEIIVSGTGGVQTNESFTLAGEVNDRSNFSFEVYQNGVKVFEGTESPFEFQASLTNGENSFSIVATDELGNKSESVEINNIYLDNVAPIISIQDYEALTKNPSFNLNATIDDASDVSTQISLNGTLVETSTSKDITKVLNLSEGVNEILISSSDQYGNVSEQKNLSIKLDTQSPVISFRDNTNSNFPTYIVDITDANNIDHDRLRVKINGELVSNSKINNQRRGNSAEVVILLYEGGVGVLEGQENTITVETSDILNNVALESERFFASFTEDDNEGPVINFDPSGGVVNAPLSFIDVYFSDRSGLNYESLEVKVGATSLSPSQLSLNEAENSLRVDLSETNQNLEINGFIIEVSISDTLNQFSTSKVGLNFYQEPGSQGGLKARILPESLIDGEEHSCVLLENSQIKCWGDNTNGQLGLGFFGGEVGFDGNPSLIPSISFDRKVTSVETSSQSSCALLEDGTAYCWGQNSYDKFGYGSSNILLPQITNPIGFSEPVQQIGMGDQFNCYLLSSGKVTCWGFGYYLGLGSISSTNNSIPIEERGYVTFPEPAKKLVSKGTSSCAILEDGKTRCWGSNNYGKLGLGHTNTIGDDETVESSGFVKITEPIQKIDFGDRHTCALLESQKVKCWGYAFPGRLGIEGTISGTYTDPSTLDYADIPEPVKDISVGYSHTCALTDNGQVYCWGENDVGQLGYGNFSNSYSYNTPTVNGALPFTKKAIAVEASNRRSCAVFEDQTMKCWGSNLSGTAGGDFLIAYGDNESVATKPVVNIGESVKSIAVGNYNSCVVTSQDRVRCWGENGLLRTSVSSPYIGDNEYINDLGDFNTSFNIKKVAIGEFHQCALGSDSKVYCWGSLRNGAGGFGGNRTSNFQSLENNPVAASFGGNVADLSTGRNYTCGLLEDGTARCTGQGSILGLGLGAFTSIGVNDLPSDYPALDFGEKAVQITSGNAHSCVLLENGDVKCWGSGLSGRLGYASSDNLGDDETLENLSVVNLGEKATKVSAGYDHTCAILESAQVKCWGARGSLLIENLSEDVGDNEDPADFSSLSFSHDVVDISAGNGFTCVVLNNGEVQCWGGNDSGQLGIGTNQTVLYSFSTPLTKVDLHNSAVSVEASHSHTCALLVSGDVQCWGNNSTSQLGYQSDFFLGEFLNAEQLPFLNLGTLVAKPSGEEGEDQPLQAYFLADLYYGPSPLGVNFDASETFSTVGDITSYQWNFGDGSPVYVSTENFSFHSFSAQGVYNVELTVTDSLGNNAFYNQYITVLGENILPDAKLSATPSSGPAPLSILFDSSLSKDQGGSIVNYRYLFGDGTVLDSTETSTNHTYTNPGHYSAKLQVQDNLGGVSTSEPVVIAVDPHPSAPTITSTTFGNVRTSKSSFSISANVQDEENVTVFIYQNGALVYSGTEKNIEQDFSLIQGNNYFEIQAEDQNGFRAVPYSIGFVTLDTDIPLISSTVKSNSYTNQNPFSLDVQVSDSTRVDTQVYVNGQLAGTSQAESFLISLNLNEGANKIEVVATDEFGNQSEPYVIANLNLDQTAPMLSNFLPLESSIVTTRDFKISAKTNEEIKEASINTFEASISSDKKALSYDVSSGTDGTYNILLKVKDLAGNETVKNYNVVVDTLPPQLSSTNTSGYLSNNSTYTINATVGDLSNTTTEIYQNGRKVYSSTDSNILYDADLSEGANSFVIKSFDEHGNEVNPTYLGDINLDSTPPDILTSLSGNLYTNQKNFNLSYNTLDIKDITSKVFNNGSEVFSSNLKSVTTSIPLNTGNNNLEIKAVDEAGNEATPITISNIFLDQTAPVIMLGSAQENFNTNQSEYLVSGVVTDSTEVETKIILNGNLFLTSNLKNFSERILLEEGFNTLQIISVDQAENQSVPISLRNIGLDTLAPVISSSVNSD